MTETTLTIHGIKARPVIAPMKRPIRTAIGTIPSAPLVLIDVFTDQGAIGRSYLFAYIPAALAPLVQLIEGMAAELKGQHVAPVARMRDFDRRFRLIGWQGLIGMAVAGLDMAFWDVTARAAEQPVVQLMGGVPCAISAYDSYGIVVPHNLLRIEFGMIELWQREQFPAIARHEKESCGAVHFWKSGFRADTVKLGETFGRRPTGCVERSGR